MSDDWRSRTAWPRALIVRGVELQLTDRECTVLKRALNVYRSSSECGANAHATSGLLHFWATAELPRDAPGLRAWRDRQRAEERAATIASLLSDVPEVARASLLVEALQLAKTAPAPTSEAIAVEEQIG